MGGQDKTHGQAQSGFKTFGLGSKLLRGISEAGFVDPRPIQAQAIGPAVEGRDILGLAQTGTGKTAAFALPLAERLMHSRGGGAGPRVLILAPTRELAAQIHKEIELLVKYTGLRAVTVFGGVPANKQIRALKARPEIVVACPGRLLDLHSQRRVDLSRVEALVLDEADHMLDMGFLPAIKKILAVLPERRQNLLFSATMPREINHLADSILRRPKRIELAHSMPAETIEHALYPVESAQKTRLLIHVLEGDDFRSGIVFLRTKHRAKQLAKKLTSNGHNAVALQGNMSQAQRVRAMEGFRVGTYDVLVATDIAARGIDVAHVSHVVNYDVPGTPDAYTHRIGRTGRSEMSGKALTFVTHEDFPMVRDIERRIGSSIPRVRLRSFGGEEAEPLSTARGRGRGRGRGRRGRGGSSGVESASDGCRSRDSGSSLGTGSGGSSGRGRGKGRGGPGSAGRTGSGRGRARRGRGRRGGGRRSR